MKTGHCCRTASRFILFERLSARLAKCFKTPGVFAGFVQKQSKTHEFLARVC